MSRTKELRFFADRPNLDSGPPLDDPLERSRVATRRGNWRRGLDWYRAQFDESVPVRGESSPLYTHPWFSYCAERILEVLGEPKLIFCVRDPVARAISHYRHAVAQGNEDRSVDAALSPTGLYALTGRYVERLDPYLERFGRKRILIIESSDLEGHRRETLAEAFRFLGVDDGFWSPAYEQRWNVSALQHGVKWHAITRLRRLPGWSRIATLPPRRSLWLIERRARSGRSGSAALPEPSRIVRERLAASLADDAARFRTLTGKAFRAWSV